MISVCTIDETVKYKLVGRYRRKFLDTVITRLGIT